MEAIICRNCAKPHNRRVIVNALKSLTAHTRYDEFRPKSTSSESHMSAWQIHQYGGNEEFSLSHTTIVPTIHSPDELLVEVHAASVNPIDFKMRGGYGQVMLNLLRKQKGCTKHGSEFPLTLGRDFSGVVVATGKKVQKYKPGDEVWGALGAHRQGSHAEMVVTSEDEISKKPKTLDHIAAASIPYVAATTWTALCDVGELKESNTAGKRVLVHAGSGGIGSFAIQLLRAWGADVTTTCSTNNMEFVRDLGADTVIDYKTNNVPQELSKLDRFDFVIDTLGGDTPNFSLDLLKKWRHSKYVTVVTPFLKNADQLGLIGGTMKTSLDLLSNVASGLKSGRGYRWTIFVPNGRALNKVAQMVDNSDIRPVVEKVFEFEQVPEAFEKVASGHARGKTVIKVK